MLPRRRTASRVVAAASCAIALALYAVLVIARALYPLEQPDLLRTAASAAGLDAALVASLVRAESRFHAEAVSPRGAIGLMQIMPDTAAWIARQLGVVTYDLTEPETNLRFGTWYLRYLLDRFGRVDLALAAYNAGPSRVDQWLAAGTPAYAETDAFVRRVLRGIPVCRCFLAAPILIRIAPALPL